MLRSQHRPFRSGPNVRQQQGAAMVYAAGAIVAMVTSTALAIDIGQLYLAQRDLQRLASSAAVDAARSLSGCYGAVGAPGNSTQMASAVASALDSSLSANLTAPGPRPDSLDVASVKRDYVVANTIEFGTFQTRPINGIPTRAFVKLPAGDDAIDAVQINLARTQPTPLIPILTSTGGLLRASAAAQQTPNVNFSISTSLASINPAILSAILGAPISAATPTGLLNADVSVPLAGIAAHLGVANLDDLLNTKITLPQALDAISGALNDAATNTGDAAQAAAAQLISQLAAQAADNSTTLGQVVNIVGDAGNNALGLSVNVAELLMALATSANQGLYPIELPISAGVGSAVTVRAFLTLGPSNTNTMQSTAQGHAGFRDDGTPRALAVARELGLAVRLGVQANKLPAVGALIAGNPLLNGLIGAPIQIGIDISGASGTAALTGVHCPAPITNGTTRPTVDITATTNTATVMIGAVNTADLKSPVIGGSLISVGPLLSIGLSRPIPAKILGVSPTVLTFGPFDKLDGAAPNASQSVGPVGADLPTTIMGLSGGLSDNLTVKVLGGLLTLPAGTLASQILNIVNPIISGPVNTLVTALGITVGGATVKVASMDYGTNSGFVVAQPTTDPSSAPVLFSEFRPGLDGAPQQTRENGSSR